MNKKPSEPRGTDSVESDLRLHVARGDAVAGAVAPVLRHLLVHGDGGLFSDDVMARLRAMLEDLARQLVEALTQAGAQEVDSARIALALVEAPGLLDHLHALALEWAITLRLAERLGLDPVLSPLLQALIASSEADTSVLAMKLLAAQARFARTARRMELPLHELPAQWLHAATHTLRDSDEAGAQAEAAIFAAYDEATTRLGLLAAVVTVMGAGAIAGLALGHAGVAIMATTLAMYGPHSYDRARDAALLAMQEGQQARLALELRAAGLKLPVIEENIQALHPLATLPEGLLRLSVERAGDLLIRLERAE